MSAEDPIDDLPGHAASSKLQMGRPSKVKPFEERIAAWLKAEPRLPSGAILERLREEGYDGGKSAVYEFVRKVRPPKAPGGIVRFEAVPGEYSQHDFGQVVVHYQDGSKERVHFFASRLKYSRLMRVRLTANERQETVCHGLVDAFTYFGGMPILATFDNPKTIVLKREGKHVHWQETFSWFTTECGVCPHANWPRCPQEKGSVENLVGFVKTSFFKVHRFRDRADMEARLEKWHAWVNDERKCRATGETPRARMMLEAQRLKPLGIDAEGYTLRYSRVVRTDGFVELFGLRYFAGHESIGRTLTVRAGKEEVRIHTGNEAVVVHRRKPVNGKYSVLPGQVEQILAKDGARPFVKRQLLMDLCPAAEWFMTEVRHRRPDRWEEEVDRIFALFEQHGAEAVRGALVDAGRRGVVGSEYIVAILEGQAGEEVTL